MITEVQPASPGEAAGFKAGDELVRVGDMPVASMLDLERGLLDSRPGRPTNLVVRRGGADQRLALDVRPLPRGMGLVSSEPGDLVWEVVGLKTMPVSTDWVSAVSPKLRGGLYIEAVSPGSPAAQAAIQKGDILVGMNVGRAALGDDPAGQHPLRPSPARGDPDPGRGALPRPPQRDPAAADQPGGDPGEEDPQPVTPAVARARPRPRPATSRSSRLGTGGSWPARGECLRSERSEAAIEESRIDNRPGKR